MLESFNQFRAIAIAIIVAGHCYALSMWQIDTFWEQTLAHLITNGTALFVFISGYLFHHVYSQRFEYRSFLGKKISGVLMPYLVVSALPIAWAVFVFGSGPYAGFAFSGDGSVTGDVLKPIVSYLISGAITPYLWYIPVILLLYVMAPLHRDYMRLPLRWQVLILLASLMAASIVLRPQGNLLAVQNLVHFTPYYLLGLLCSQYRPALLPWQHRAWWFLALAVGFALLQTALFGYAGLKRHPDWAHYLPDIVILQKSALCLFFLLFLARWDQVRVAWLNRIADGSFAIYFLHGYVILLLEKYLPLFSFPGADWLWLPLALPVLLISLGLGWLIKQISGRYSRQVIGW